MASRTTSVKIRFAHRDTLPPVYIAGSFSETPWIPQEMEYIATADGQFLFSKEVELEAGKEYQYKFRLGPGDWWVLDEEAPIVTDAAGNRNNAITASTDESPFKLNDELVGSKHVAMESEHTTEIPTLLVEKMDNQPSYGDDFGENATVAQKDAHEMRAKDAEPDYTIIMPEKENTEPSNTDRKSPLLQGDATAGEGKATTPIAEVAATAAEVADAAAELDREPTPLPPSIEDAGRTGERRMSHTPITEVAETAAEVADSAATIDKDGSSEKATKLLERTDAEDVAGSGAATPIEDRAPLFAYECVGEFEGNDVPRVQENTSPLQNEAPWQKVEEIDLNDPSIEQFPEDRAGILTKIRTTESHLNADQTHFEGAPLSPVIGPSGTPLFAPQPEPELSTTAVSPSTILESQVTPPTPPLLDKIVEGDEETIPVEPFPAIRFADQEGHHQPTGTGIGLEEIDSKLAPLEGSSPSNRTHPPTTAGSLSGIRAPLPTAEPTPAVEMKKPIFDSFPDMQGGLGGLRKPSGRASSDASLSTKMEGADGNNPQERTRTGLLGSVSEERELTADTGKEKHLYKVDLSADGPVEERGDDDMKGKGKGKGIVNVVADKVQALVSKIGVADSLPQPTTFEDSNVKAGQPAVDHVIHIAESSNETNDSGKSTGRDEESALVGGKLKKRQGGVIERPRSAQSLRPTTEDGGKVSRSWLSSIWRTVIVGWLGGFWKKLFGRGRTQSRPVTPVSATRNG